MILINNNWEMVNTLQGISNIIREYYNSELADKLDNLIPEHDDFDYGILLSHVDNLEDEIFDLESEIESKDCKIEEQEKKIEELLEVICELEDEIERLEA